jgi:N-acetylneuraminic acid mutarotase
MGYVSELCIKILNSINMQSKIYSLAILFSLACLVWQCGNDDNGNNPNPTPDTPIALSLTSFSPARDTIGANVTLTGTGFSTTTSQNIVKFNGTVAQVTNASATSLTVKVPTGATKGKISVEVSSKTVSSTDDFVVTGWQKKTDFGGAARAGGSGFMLNGKLYYGLGVKGFGGANVTVSADFWEYTPATDTWVKKANHPAIADGSSMSTSTVTYSHLYFAINGKGYVGLGSLRALWEYDPTANTWTKKNDNHPLGTTTSLQDPFAFVVNGKAYVGGGNNGTARRELYEYDPVANTWTKKADFPNTNGIYRAQAFAIGTKGYVGAGVVGSGTNKFWEYDTATNTWKEVASYPGVSASDAVATTLNGKGYVRIDGKMYEYTPTSNTWATLPYKPTFRLEVAISLGEQIYWMGGGGLTKDFWSYLP